jgi:chromate transporter
VLRVTVADLWAPIRWFEIFFRMGALIFGGGQVVLPMLLEELVGGGFISEVQFFNGFALAQALPGPLVSCYHK